MARESPLEATPVRLNRAPIFLNCMSRGGSNIFWNLFLTHPGVCSPIRETLEIFRADHRAPTKEGLWLALTSGQPRLFDQWNLKPRRPLSASRQSYVDRVLYRNKLLTAADEEMRYKHRDEVYTAREVERARLVAKNNNALVFLNEVLRGIYPDAFFFGLVRHPVALYESHKRRRLWRSPAAFADFYHRITGRMADDAERFERAFLVRFEDVLADPIAVLRQVCSQAELDFDRIREVRLRSKAHFRENGSRGADWELGRHHWLDFEEARRFLEPKINRLQAERLGEKERRAVLEQTAAARGRLGYAAGDGE